MNQKLKIALLQINSFNTDQRGNLIKGEEYCRMAKDLNADIVLFPEMWNIGYESFNESAIETGFDPRNIPESIKNEVNLWTSNALEIDSEFVEHYRKSMLREQGLRSKLFFSFFIVYVGLNYVQLKDKNNYSLTRHPKESSDLLV